VRAVIRQEPYLGFNALGDVYLAGRGNLASLSVPETVAPVGPTIPVKLRVSQHNHNSEEPALVASPRLGCSWPGGRPKRADHCEWQEVVPIWPTRWGKDVRCGGCISSSLDLSSIGIHLGEAPVLDGITVVKARSSRPRSNSKSSPSTVVVSLRRHGSARRQRHDHGQKHRANPSAHGFPGNSH
jgi:hypothetical protein